MVTVRVGPLVLNGIVSVSILFLRFLIKPTEIVHISKVNLSISADVLALTVE